MEINGNWEIIQEKDGRIRIKFNSMDIGTLDEIEPVRDIAELKRLIETREEVLKLKNRSNTVDEELKAKIQTLLAKLLIYYQLIL